MQPFIRIFGLTLQAQPFVILIGYVAASWLAGKAAARRGLDEDVVSSALFVSGIAWLVGARLGYVILNLNAYLPDPLSALALNASALNTWTGLIIASAVFATSLRLKGELTVAWLDPLAPAAAVFAMGLALASYFDGSAYGLPTTAPWAANVWGVNRHPVQIYEIAGLAVLLIALVRLPATLPAGALALTFVCAYAALRLALAGLRADPMPLVAGMRVEQIAAAVVAATAAFLLGEHLTDSRGSTANLEGD